MTSNQLIDLHCHLLPKLDDGSPSLEASLTLARQAVADGIGYVLATPHHYDRHYVNHAVVVRQAVQQFQNELDRQGIALTVFPGQEVHLNGQLLDHLDDLLGIDQNRRYLLLELPHEMVPAYLDETIFELSCQGITPVLAHPERNAQLLAEPQRLYQLVQQGCLAQVTASSLVGTFGAAVQRMVKEFVQCNLVQVVASDAHALKQREFVLREAYEVLGKMDSGYPQRFKATARQLLNGEPVEMGTVRVPRKSKRFWLF
ncbi:tyrosine-protein phosphatase [Lactiplantibacillus modestisalitolerans]|uniref:Tyrosine-protein phosphatase n=1 Tax=Lactiplantibacillus modestisalitolerans TaxID=1457219 RepID=A0ABV5WUN7_9LACO|nr:CpsB/CapC family capsule biosynthesis tyrosine phosphatase [Lactiplantibacillus modestisalitolerans]